MQGNSPNYFLSRVVNVAPGESGYFSAPSDALDPNLFNGERLRPEVRLQLQQTLYTYLATRWKQAPQWAVAWLAGSGISYQWSAGRGNGDLDVLLGVDWTKFRQTNPGYEGLADRELAFMINQQLKTELWPRTALTRFGTQTYEATYFINLNSADIRNIKPYAAYNLASDTWTVRPPKLPKNPASMYPRAWRIRIDAEAHMAGEILDRYNEANRQLSETPPHTGAWTNATAAARLAAAQAAALYDDIHMGRRAAFDEQGDGYSDWHNYRWQSHKANGIVTALAAVAKVRSQALDRTQLRLYGHTIPTEDQSRISALTWRTT